MKNVIEIKSGKVRKNLANGKKGSAKRNQRVKNKGESGAKRTKTPKTYKNRKGDKTPNKRKKGSNLKNKTQKSANRNKKSGKIKTATQKVTKGKKKTSKAKLNAKNASPIRKDLGQPGPETEKKQGENSKWLQEELKKVTQEDIVPIEAEKMNLGTVENETPVEVETVLIGTNEDEEVEVEANPGDEQMEKILRSKLKSFEPKSIELQIANGEKFPSRSGKLRSQIEEAVLNAGRGGKVDVKKIMGGMKGFFNTLLVRK